MQAFVFTCPFCVHLDADNSQVGRANAYTGTSFLSFGLCGSHLLDGVDAHDGHSVAWDHTVAHIPERGGGQSETTSPRSERGRGKNTGFLCRTCRSRAAGDAASPREAPHPETPAGGESESQRKRSGLG